MQLSFLFLSLLFFFPIFSERISYTYWDDGEKKVWLDTDLIAQFDTKEPTNSQKRMASNLTVHSKYNGFIVYQTKDPVVSRNIQANQLQQVMPHKSSQVFFEHKESTIPMTLPGNVIVYFEMNLSESDIKNLLDKKGLKIVRKMPFQSKNAYTIETPSGIDSLNIANSLSKEKGVLSCIPNWMKVAVRR